MAAENEGKILVEIVLDDGSIQKGFAKIKTAAKETGQEATKDLSTIGDVLDAKPVDLFIKKIRDIPAPLVAIGVAAVGVGTALKAAFDLAVEGEQLKAIDKQFDSFAQSAGLSADGLRQALIDAGQGMVEIDELTKAATQSIINLGQGASRLPEILDLARKATLALGGNIEDRFEGISRAIETGNVRALRNQGIILDSDKVLKEYARTLGITAGELTLAQRQQAVLNATLTEGQKRYKDVDSSAQPIQDNLTKIRTAAKDLREEFAKFVNSQFGQVFADITRKIADMLRAYNLAQGATGLQKQAQDAAELRGQIIQTEARIAKLNKQIAESATAGKSLGDWGAVEQVTKLRAELVKAQNELPKLQAAFARTGATTTAATETSSINKLLGIDPEKAKTEVKTFNAQLTEEQIRAEQERANRILQLQAQTRAEELNAEAAQIESLTLFDNQRELQEKLHLERMGQLRLEQGLALQQAESQYSADQGFSDEEREAARLAIVQKYNARIEAETTRFNTSQAQKFKSLGQIAKEVFQNQMGSAFAAFGAALASGEDAGRAFARILLGVFGDIAIQLGTSYILQGIAISANPFTLGAGTPLIVAGAALATFGGALKALSGGGGGVGSTSGGGGGVAASPDATNPVNEITPQEEKVREANTSVVINIQGDILDSDETGSRIIGLVNDAFDKKGVQIRRGAVG